MTATQDSGEHLLSRRVVELEDALQALLDEPVIDAEQWARWAQDLARFVLTGDPEGITCGGIG